MQGEVIYLYAYDIAYEADLAGIEKMMVGAAERFCLAQPKDAPRNFPIYRPLVLRTEEMHLVGPAGPVALSTSIKLFELGAISVKVRMPVTFQHFTDLVAFRDLKFADGTTLDHRVTEIAQRLFTRIAPHLDTPVASLAQPEVYTIFCIHSPLEDPSELPDRSKESTLEWLNHHQELVAALLDGESNPSCLSKQEIEETTKYTYSYYRNDLTVVDWDAALVIDTPAGNQDTLYVLELANLQLEELKVYDAMLDAVLDKAYDDVELATRPRAFRSRQRVLDELREIRMDLTQVADELSNITKFFGDWHLARIYMGWPARFHLSEWEETVGQKLRSLDGLYTILQHDSLNRLMLMLEIAVVGLFVIDLVIIVALGLK